MVNVFQASRLALLDLLGRLGTDTRRWTFQCFFASDSGRSRGFVPRGEDGRKKKKREESGRPLIKSFLPDIVIVPSPDVRLIVASSIEP